MSRNWKNIPLPEVHLTFLVIGLALHFIKPIPILRTALIGKILAFPLIGTGLFIAGWAVREVRHMDIQSPSKVVTSGPYGFSRHPMYLGWTSLILGIAFLANTFWLILFLPIVVAITHYFVILNEENYMERKYIQEYLRYHTKIRRYL